MYPWAMSMVTATRRRHRRGPQLLEELLEGGLLLPLADPDHVTRLVVPDDGQVLVLAAAVADLVDADEPELAPEATLDWIPAPNG
jgi:hypothetical protein